MNNLMIVFKKWFRWIRMPNLLIISITLIVMAFVHTYPPLTEHGIIPKLAVKDFGVLLLVVICLAAGGYLHNDLVDFKVDKTNEKRSRRINKFGKSMAILIYILLSVLPIPLVIFLASEVGHDEYILLYFAVVGLLYLYNQYLKKMPLVGNVIVALLCASIVGLIYFGEIDQLRELKEIDNHSFNSITQITIAYMVFSFFSNLIREIVKDMEDIKGDLSAGYSTFPIVFGMKVTRRVIATLTVVMLVIICWYYWGMGSSLFTEVSDVISLFILLTMGIYILYKILLSTGKSNYSQLSRLLKIYMLIGLIVLIFYGS